MACNANEHAYHFFFDNIDLAQKFIDTISILLNSSGCVSLSTLNGLAGINTANDIYGMSVKWYIEDLEGTDWRNPKLDGDLYIVSMPRNISVKKTGNKNDKPDNVNAKSPNPIAVAINASCLTEEDFARIYREVMDVATEIKDRDILIQIV